MTPDQRNAVLEEAIEAVRSRLVELTGDRRCDDEYRYELNVAISRIRALKSTPKDPEQ